MIGLHLDNGSEFLNYYYIEESFLGEARKRFEFTRSRACAGDDVTPPYALAPVLYHAASENEGASLE